MSAHDGAPLVTTVLLVWTTTPHDTKEQAMFTELTEELLDLQATVRGYGDALYAVEEDPGSSCNCSCCNLCCCCSCCNLCW
jgi:hypothetical protein